MANEIKRSDLQKFARMQERALLQMYKGRHDAALSTFSEISNLASKWPAGRVAPFPVTPPNMVFVNYSYDTGTRKGIFVNPTDVVPSLKSTEKYQLDFQLLTLHLDDNLVRSGFNPEKPLEHRIYTSVPLSTEGAGSTDFTTWIVSSAIEVFGEKDRQGRDKKLEVFAKNTVPTATLKGQEKIFVEHGKVKLRQGLWGHRKKNLFPQIWAGLTGIVKSPIIQAVGLPALVPTAFEFVNTLLTQYDKKSALIKLWDTIEVPFRVSQDVKASYSLIEGYWVVIDVHYYRDSSELANHTIDIRGMTFEVLDSNQKPVDAVYLVGDLSLPKVS